MKFLMECGVCCLLLSIWAIVQLSLMGVFYFMESTVLIEDAEAHVYETYDDFLAKTKENYKQIANNCWITAGIYVFMVILAYSCIKSSRKKASLAAALVADDEYSCTTGLPKPKKQKPK